MVQPAASVEGFTFFVDSVMPLTTSERQQLIGKIEMLSKKILLQENLQKDCDVFIGQLKLSIELNDKLNNLEKNKFDLEKEKLLLKSESKQQKIEMQNELIIRMERLAQQDREIFMKTVDLMYNKLAPKDTAVTYSAMFMSGISALGVFLSIYSSTKLITCQPTTGTHAPN